MRVTRYRSMFSMLLLACSAIASLPAAAQSLPEDECARLEDPEAEVTCLRAVLAATRQAQQGASVEGNRGASSLAPAVPARVPATVGTTPVRQAPAAPELGSEQLAGAAFAERDPADQEMVVSTVTDFRTDRNDRLIMQLENGQIWRQVESVAIPVRFAPEDRVRVEITRSGFGGYRMNFPDLDRRISVSRER